MTCNIDAKYIGFKITKEFIQSANSLFKFMTKLDYLKQIIKDKAFIPRYYEELIPYLNLENFEKIAFPMTCFCDINIQKIHYHCDFYGFMGLGMDKNWGIKNGIQPIHYINENSRLVKELEKLFVVDDDVKNECILEPYKDYLLEHVLFIKPIEGKMLVEGEYKDKNFHDEREWRYVPNIETECELPEVLSYKSFMNVNAYKRYSDAIYEYQNLWLKFTYDDIKYIFVKDNNDRNELIIFIIDLDINDMEKYILISKIITLDIIRRDI